MKLQLDNQLIEWLGSGEIDSITFRRPRLNPQLLRIRVQRGKTAYEFYIENDQFTNQPEMLQNAVNSFLDALEGTANSEHSESNNNQVQSKSTVSSRSLDDQQQESALAADDLKRSGCTQDIGTSKPSERNKSEVILEYFEGVVDKITKDIAYVSLRSESGELFHGQYKTADFARHQITEHSRFSCKTIQSHDKSVRVELSRLPDKTLSSTRLQELESQIGNVLAKYHSDDDY